MNTAYQPERTSEWIKDNKIEKKSSIFSWIRFILLLAGLLFFFRFVIGITFINGNSMNPTLHNNDIVVTSNIFYKVDRNDIVIVRDPHGFNIIKRIIALPGETVAIKNGMVYVNGNSLKESFTLGISNDMPPIKVKTDHYFIMGDNRTPGESLDSRNSEIGPISKNQIIGQSIASYFH